MFPAPLDLSTARKSTPTVRVFKKIKPLDLTVTREAHLKCGPTERDADPEVRRRSEGRADELSGELRGKVELKRRFAEDGLVNGGSEKLVGKSTARGSDGGREVELHGTPSTEVVDGGAKVGLPKSFFEEEFAAEWLNDDLEVRWNGSFAEVGSDADLSAKFRGKASAEGDYDVDVDDRKRRFAEEGLVNGGSEKLLGKSTAGGSDDCREIELHGTSSTEAVRDSVKVAAEGLDDDMDFELNMSFAEDGGNYGLSEDGELENELDGRDGGLEFPETAIFEVAQRVAERSPRKPFAVLPVQTNRLKTHSSSGKASRSLLTGVSKNKRPKYSLETLSLAIEQVRNGTMTCYKAAKEFSIPKNTLSYRLGENFKGQGRKGPATVLTCDEETKIVNWVKEMQRKAFPVTTEALRRKISVFLKENPRPNPFRENLPGRRWLEGFLRRHKDVSIRTPEAISKASANVSEADLRQWHAKIGRYVHDHGLEAILEEPSRMLSGDETGMPMNITAQKVLAEKGSKNVSIVEPSNAKQTTTVLFTFSADGHSYPPLVVLPQQRIGKEIAQHYPGDWGLGGTETGWMDTAHFVGHIKKVLHPALVKRNVQFPVIYFVDGHKSHMSLAVVEACLKLQIVLISLYPNSTRIIQPADVGVFGPLKHYWKKEVAKFKDENGENAKITPLTFPEILKSAMKQAFKIKTVSESFKPCGLFPFNADAVDYTKCFGKSRENPAHPEDRNSPSSPEEQSNHASHNHGTPDHTLIDNSSLNLSVYSSSEQSTDVTMGQSSSFRSGGESWHDSYDAASIPVESTSLTVEPIQSHSSSGGATSLECDISKYLTTPKTPERSGKHINYKTKSNPILTAAERLEEIRRIEEEKKNLLQRKIEMAEKKVQQKAEQEIEKNKRVEERKRKAEESKAVREEKQRKMEERKRKCEEKKAKLEEEKKKRFEEREKKAAERKRKQEEVAEKKRERQAKKEEVLQPSDADSEVSDESEDEIEYDV